MNLIRTILIASLLALYSFGCAHGSSPHLSPLIGTWSGTDSDNMRLVCIFKEGGVFSAMTAHGNVSGSYTIDGTSFSGVISDRRFNGTFSDNVIHITDDEGVTATLSRE